MTRTNILVTGTGSLIGQAVLKSIIRSPVRDRVTITGCDYFKGTAGSYWCNENWILPDLLDPTKEEAWKKAVKSIVSRNDIKAVFVGVDFELSYFADMRKELEEQYECMVVVSDRSVIDIGNDKFSTYEFLVRNGLNAPVTYHLETADIGKLGFPMVLKPRVGARSRGVEVVENKEAFDGCFERYKGKGYIAQQHVGTKETEYTCGVLGWDGKCISSIILRRILKDGNTVFAECNSNEETRIKGYIEKIANRLKPFGSCDLQLRVDGSGTPYLFEINPRFSGTTYMRTLFGYNEVEYIICRIAGWDLPQMRAKTGRAYRYYEERLVAD